MQSLIAWLKVTRKSTLQVEEVDVGSNPSLTERLRVVRTPTLVVVADGQPAARLEGRATGKQIDDLLRPFLG
jgi:thioredoxin-like negative regulator of GroEL